MHTAYAYYANLYTQSIPIAIIIILVLEIQISDFPNSKLSYIDSNHLKRITSNRTKNLERKENTKKIKYKEKWNLFATRLSF